MDPHWLDLKWFEICSNFLFLVPDWPVIPETIKKIAAAAMGAPRAPLTAPQDIGKSLFYCSVCFLSSCENY